MEDQLKYRVEALTRMREERDNDQQLITDLQSRFVDMEHNQDISSIESFIRLQHEYEDLQFRYDLLNGSYQSIQIEHEVQLRQNDLSEHKLNQQSYHVTDLENRLKLAKER